MRHEIGLLHIPHHLPPLCNEQSCCRKYWDDVTLPFGSGNGHDTHYQSTPEEGYPPFPLEGHLFSKKGKRKSSCKTHGPWKDQTQKPEIVPRRLKMTPSSSVLGIEHRACLMEVLENVCIPWEGYDGRSHHNQYKDCDCVTPGRLQAICDYDERDQ